MARAKYQVLVIPYSKTESSVLYCVFKRSDAHDCGICYIRFYYMCTDEDHDCWCDECGNSIPCVDEDGDGICDVCGELMENKCKLNKKVYTPAEYVTVKNVSEEYHFYLFARPVFLSTKLEGVEWE